MFKLFSQSIFCNLTTKLLTGVISYGNNYALAFARCKNNKQKLLFLLGLNHYGIVAFGLNNTMIFGVVALNRRNRGIVSIVHRLRLGGKRREIGMLLEQVVVQVIGGSRRVLEKHLGGAVGGSKCFRAGGIMSANTE